MATATLVFGFHDYSEFPPANITINPDTSSMWEVTKDASDSTFIDSNAVTTKSGFWVTATAYSNIPLSCGVTYKSLWIRAKRLATRSCTLGYYRWCTGAASMVLHKSAYTNLTTTLTTYKMNFSSGLAGPRISPLGSLSSMRFGVKSGSALGANKNEWVLAKIYASIAINYDTLAPSIPTILVVGGYTLPVSSNSVNLYPTLSFRYQDSTNATGGNYDSTKWVRWIVGTSIDGSTIYGTVWDSGQLATTCLPGQSCVIQYGSINSLERNIHYYAKVNVCDLNNNQSSSAPASFLTIEDPWWNLNWHRRQRINFGTSHGTIPAGYTVEIPFVSGVTKCVSTTGQWNESVQPGSISRRRGNKTWMAWRNSGPSAGAWVAVYHHDTDSLGTIIGPIGYLSGSDSHASPVIQVDNYGYLHLLLGSHGGSFKHYKSKQKETLVFPGTAMDAGGGTYPDFNITSENDLYIFSRAGSEDTTGWVRCTAASTVAFLSWQPLRTFAWFPTSMAPAKYNARTRIYGGGWVDPKTNRCHNTSSWDCWYDTITTNTYAVSYMYSDLTADGYVTWKTISGTIVGYATTAATSHNMVCYSSINKFIYPWGAFSQGELYGGLGVSVTDSGTLLGMGAKFSSATSWSYFVMQPPEMIFWKTSYTNKVWSSLNVSNELGGLAPWNRRHGAGQFYRRPSDNKYVMDMYIVSKDDTEKQFAGELNLVRSVDLGVNWSYKPLSKNSVYGIGRVMTAGIATRYSECVYGPGNDVRYFNSNLTPTTSFIANGDDIRIVFGTRQLDRLPDTSWNYDKTKVRFRVQEEIPANQEPKGDAYYLYFGNYFASGTAPRNPRNVYRFFENWSAWDNYQSPLSNFGSNYWQGNFGCGLEIFRSFGSYSEQHPMKIYSADHAVSSRNAADGDTIYCILPEGTHKHIQIEWAHCEDAPSGYWGSFFGGLD